MLSEIDKITQNWESIGLEGVLKQLLQINRKENLGSFQCKNLIYECFIALKKYSEFLTFSTPSKIYFINDVADINLRLSVQKKLGLEANPLDVYRTHFPTQSKIVKANAKLFEKYLIRVFESYATKKNGWFNIFESAKLCILKSEPFNGSFKTHSSWGKSIPDFDFTITNYVSVAMKDLHSTIKNLTTEAENLIRQDYGLPPIEVSWRTEKFLYRRLKSEFPNTEIILHGKPDWLGKQHFDIWIPEWKIAVEYQGMYHFEPVNGKDELEKTIERDKRKMELAIQNGVILFLETSSNHDQLISEIRKCVKDINIK